MPSAKRVAITWDPRNPSHKPGIEVLTRAARNLGIQVVLVEIPGGSDIANAWLGLAGAAPDAVVTLPDNWLVKQRAEFVKGAQRHRVPVMYWRKEFVEAGGLIAYGADNPAQYRRAAVYVHKILRGARPGELAVEQVQQYELLVNARAAKEAGLRIPQSILVRADKVLE